MSQPSPLERAKKALEWYADPISYAVTQAKEPRSAVHADRGKRAKAALAVLRELEEREVVWYVGEYRAEDGRWPAVAAPTRSRSCAEADCRHPLYEGFETRVVPLVRAYKEGE